MVFAKKTKTKNIAGDVYVSRVESYTHGRVYEIIVSKDFLKKEDRVLLIDDFLANGKALEGLADLVEQAGAVLVGAGVVIEKGFQPGGDIIRSRGIRLESSPSWMKWMKRQGRSASGIRMPERSPNRLQDVYFWKNF